MQANYNMFTTVNKLVYALQIELCEFLEKPVILCLGSEKIIADSLGPLVGHLLTKKYHIDTIVYGALGRSIDKQNVKTYYNHIIKTHQNKKILVVDASVGKLEQFGIVQIKKGGVLTSGNNFVKPLGDITVTGVVLPNDINLKYLLHQTKLNFIYEMAEKIAYTICHSFTALY